MDDNFRGQNRVFPHPLPKLDGIPSEEALRRSEFPPILAPSLWTRCVPFKEQFYHRTPSESIGSNYSPWTQHLHIDQLKVKQHSSQNSPAKQAAGFSVCPPGREKFSHHRRDTLSQPSSSSEAEPENSEAASSRPLSPGEQLDIMCRQEEEMRASQTEPSNSDMERYEYYYNNCIPISEMAPYPHQHAVNIMKLLPPEPEDNKKDFQMLRENLLQQAEQEYYFSNQKSIVDYILMDPSELQRLSISSIPKPFPRRVISAPVPWSLSYKEARLWQSQHLFVTSPMMFLLQNIWNQSISCLRFVKLEDLMSTTWSLPLPPSEFEQVVQRQCQAARDELLQSWLPACASLFVNHESLWLSLIPSNKQAAHAGVQEFFSCVAALMSLQLRGLVTASLQDLQEFFMIHQEGNDFGETFDEMRYNQPQKLLVELQVEDTHIEFTPSLQECWEVIHRAFMEIVKSAEKLPRVECKLFSHVSNLYLRTVGPDELLVTNIVDNVKEVFHKNTVGLKKYLIAYEKYSDLLDSTADQDVAAFLKEQHTLDEAAKNIESLDDLEKEIASLCVTAPLSMFCLHAGELNAHLSDCAKSLKDKIIIFKKEENRNLNKDICQRFGEIRDTVQGMPTNKEDLETLMAYNKVNRDATVPSLMDEVRAAVHRLLFLLDYATMEPDDFRLNSLVFAWPLQIQKELEDSESRMEILTEQDLQTRSEEIRAAASEEETLKKSVEKMKEEWAELCFSFTTCRDAGTKILSSIEDIQTLLDEHMIKTQTMRGSPFIEHIETEWKEWEKKLLNMKDILNAMLKCQTTWLHLKPIFSSGDVIIKLPEESLVFDSVDKYWRNVVADAVKDPRVLVATDQPDMLKQLQEANKNLEDIQKVLNDVE